jgi:hypothetical protein
LFTAGELRGKPASHRVFEPTGRANAPPITGSARLRRDPGIGGGSRQVPRSDSIGTKRRYSTANATLKHTINAAVLIDNTARARSVRFSISASMSVYAERPVSFRRRANENTVGHQRQFRFYFSSASRVSTCPQRRHSKVCLTAGFAVAIMDIPHFGHGGRRGSFGMRKG